MPHTEQKTAPKPKQTKITVALDAYQDVKAMVGRYYEKFPDDGPTDFMIPALRVWLKKNGFGRKGDLAK